MDNVMYRLSSRSVDELLASVRRLNASVVVYTSVLPAATWVQLLPLPRSRDSTRDIYGRSSSVLNFDPAAPSLAFRGNDESCFAQELKDSFK
jgi:hypothetical protein